MRKIKTWKLFENTNHLVEVIPNRYVYHTSNPIFRDKISKEGLIPKGKSESWLSDTKIDGKVIFVVNDNKDNYRFDSTYDDDIYRIDTIGLNNKWYNDPNFNDGLHLITFDSIPLSAIELDYSDSFSLDESLNSIDYIEGELEDIVIHYCEGKNVDFELECILCDGGVFIWKIDESIKYDSRSISIHNNMALELGYSFKTVKNYLIFTKFGTLRKTFEEILNWISGLELNRDVSDYSSGEVLRPFISIEGGKRVKKSYSIGGKVLVEWSTWINSDGLESPSSLVGSFKPGFRWSERSSVYIYLSDFLYQIYRSDPNVSHYIRSWLDSVEPLLVGKVVTIKTIN